MSAAVVLAALAGAGAALAVGDGAVLARRVPRGGMGRGGGRLGALVVRAAGRLGLPGPPGDLAARIAAADGPAWLGTREAMAVKSLLGALGAAVALLVGPVLPGRLGVPALAAAPACGFLALDLMLVRRARRRAAAVRAEAPDLLDRVRLACDAGLAPAEALARAARDGHGPLAAELRAIGAAAAWGEAREDGLRRLTGRLPVPEVRALAAAVRRSERHGAPLGPAVGSLAAGARAARTSRVRDRAQRAAPKIQLVVALLLVPAVLLLVAAGLLTGLR